MSLEELLQKAGSPCSYYCGKTFNPHERPKISLFEGKKYEGKEVFVAECSGPHEKTENMVIMVFQQAPNRPSGFREIRAKTLDN